MLFLKIIQHRAGICTLYRILFIHFVLVRLWGMLTVLNLQVAGCVKVLMFPRMIEAIGVDSFYNNKWAAWGAEIVNPIGCADCHEPKNMDLHISRPSLTEAF